MPGLGFSWGTSLSWKLLDQYINTTGQKLEVNARHMHKQSSGFATEEELIPLDRRLNEEDCEWLLINSVRR